MTWCSTPTASPSWPRTPRGIDAGAAGRAVDLVLETRRRLRVNVSEELALEALWLRLASTLAG